jgi:hypothetical protein
MHFGMRLAGALVKSLADNLAARYDNAADPRIGRSRKQAAPCKLQRARHEPVIVGMDGSHFAAQLRRRARLERTVRSAARSAAARAGRCPETRMDIGSPGIFLGRFECISGGRWRCRRQFNPLRRHAVG